MERQGAGVDWSQMYVFKREINGRFPTIWDVPLEKKLQNIVERNLKGSERVLDVGAFLRGLEKRLHAKFPGVVYKSMDNDRSNPHDYYAIDDIHEEFDMIVLSEVIEHIPLDEGISLLRKLLPLLAQGGRLILSTPNVFMPSRFLSDPTHRAAYAYDELGGILRSLGYRIADIYRLYNDALIRRFFRIYITSHIHRYLAIDFAKSIAIVAQR